MIILKLLAAAWLSITLPAAILIMAYRDSDDMPVWMQVFVMLWGLPLILALLCLPFFLAYLSFSWALS